MTKRNLTTPIIILLALIASLSACQRSSQWTIEGEIEGAEGQKVVLIEVLPQEVNRVDSALLDDKGTFKMRIPKSPTPRFYRIDLNGETLLLASDSATHEVRFKSKRGQLFESVRWIEPSTTTQALYDIDQYERKIFASIQTNRKAFEMGAIDLAKHQAVLDSLVGQYKAFARPYIEQNPGSMQALFALLFQRDNSYYFDPYSLEDGRLLGMVATAFSNDQPESPYTPEVRRILSVFQAYQKQQAQSQQTMASIVSSATVKEFPPINLPSLNHSNVSLEEIAQRHSTVIVAFHSFEWEGSPQVIQKLKEWYPSIKAEGGNIFMVSIDRDWTFWSEAVRNLPWINVLDLNTQSASVYNIDEVPQFFVIRNGKMHRVQKTWSKIHSLQDLFA